MFVFSENLSCFVFLLPPFWDSPFCLIIDEIGVEKTNYRKRLNKHAGNSFEN